MSYPGDQNQPPTPSGTEYPSQPPASPSSGEAETSPSPWSGGLAPVYQPAPSSSPYHPEPVPTEAPAQAPTEAPAEAPTEPGAAPVPQQPPAPTYQPAPTPAYQPPAYQPAAYQPAAYQPAAYPPAYQPAAYQPAPYAATAPTPAQPGAPTPSGYPAPPTFDPTAAQQFSSPPVSAYPYAYGLPQVAPPQAPRNKGGRSTLILSILVALLVGATGVMTTLYLLQMHETTKANNEIHSVSGQRDGLSQELAKAKTDLQTAKDDADRANEDKQTILDCLKGVFATNSAFEANGNKINPQIQAMIDDTNAKCRKATPFL